MEIDATLHIHPIGARSIPDPTEGSYYFFFHAATLISVEHFLIKPKVRERLFYLEARPSFLLDRTVKQDEIWKGPYGTLYATKTCFYDRTLENGLSTVSVGSYYNQLGHNDLGYEIPIQLPKPPEDLPPLTSVSIVRVFRNDPSYAVVSRGYVIVSANYQPEGKLGSLHVDKTLNGDWVRGIAMVAEPDSVLTKTDEATYGVAKHIDIQQYLRLQRLSFAPSKFPEVLELLNRHYGYDKIIRQDTLHRGITVASRFLQPSVTDEEKVLDPVCESHFHQQEAAGLRTVD